MLSCEFEEMFITALSMVLFEVTPFHCTSKELLITLYTGIVTMYMDNVASCGMGVAYHIAYKAWNHLPSEALYATSVRTFKLFTVPLFM